MPTSRRRGQRRPTVPEAFGQVLRELRTEKGISQERLSLDSGSHRTFVSLLERGLKGPSLTTILRFSGTLEVPAAEIVRRVEALSPRLPDSVSRGT